MISAEAPVLFAKAAEVFITELSLRAWIHTEDNKRRTLQRNDIAMAISKYDQFDFLIDIVPRDELTKPPPTKRSNSSSGMIDGQSVLGGQQITLGGQQVTISGIGNNQVTIPSDQVQMYLQQLQQQQQQQQSSTQQGTQQLQVLQAPGPGGGVAICINSQGQLVQVQVPPSVPPTVQQQPPQTSGVTVSPTVPANDNQSSSPNNNSTITTGPTITGPGGQTLQLQLNPAAGGGGGDHGQQQQPQQQQIVLQHIVNSNGQVQQVPIQINAQQLAALRMQLAGQSAGGQSQPILIQTGGQQQQPQQYQIATSGGQQFVIASTTGQSTSAGGQEEDSQDGQGEEDDDGPVTGDDVE